MLTRLKKFRAALVASVLLLGVGYAAPAASTTCDQYCPFDSVGIFDDCRLILDGVECLYDDYDKYPSFGGSC